MDKNINISSEDIKEIMEFVYDSEKLYREYIFIYIWSKKENGIEVNKNL